MALQSRPRANRLSDRPLCKDRCGRCAVTIPPSGKSSFRRGLVFKSENERLLLQSRPRANRLSDEARRRAALVLFAVTIPPSGKSSFRRHTKGDSGHAFTVTIPPSGKSSFRRHEAIKAHRIEYCYNPALGQIVFPTPALLAAAGLSGIELQSRPRANRLSDISGIWQYGAIRSLQSRPRANRLSDNNP